MRLFPLKKIADHRGMVLQMMRPDREPFNQFGEIYFSLIFPDVIKGWKMHPLQVQNMAVPVGRVHFVFYDGRLDSPTQGRIYELETGQDDYQLIHVPTGIFYAFKCLSGTSSLVAACPETPHDPQEAVVWPLDTDKIPYQWGQ
jgi:dTDP-4-dehydrorhamnose 3,5-epimerase